MSKNLLIVESPAKAKTIEKYLGADFTVKSSYGHVRDLAKDNMGIDKTDNFKPNYIVYPDKQKVVKELMVAAKKADEIWLATDEDREGEAISWHLCEVLGLDEKTTKRIVFREITKNAIQEAITKPRLLDRNLVDAQQARRILDRLVGFELSELLWRKVKNKLSAGRVQSVAVKLIVEREREIQKFDAEAYFKIMGQFALNAGSNNIDLKAESPARYNEKARAREILEKANGARFTISDIKVKPLKRKPTAPFTTSTLQQEASRKLGFAVKRTMSAAQKLYEQGLITYMRTDSTTLSATAIAGVTQEIETSYGKQYVKVRTYKSKAQNAQEAHEAIRPTFFQQKNISGSSDLQRLYDLIWKRTVASQMADAELEKTTLEINISTVKDVKLTATGEVLKFDGFLKVYMESNDDEEEDTKGILPPVNLGQELHLIDLVGLERYTRPPARYTEASLVQKLEELGIGRPSTYAPTISRIMEEGRGYVTKESRVGEERFYDVITLQNGKIREESKSEITGSTSNRLYPSDIGMVVTDFLDEHFDQVMDYNFTADIESQFDKIAIDGRPWTKVIQNFYDPFHKVVEDTMENAERAKGRRDLGIDPASGHKVIVQMTRFGPVVQIGDRDEVGEEKPRFANLRPGQSMETITFDEAIELFKLPKSLGDYKGLEVSVNSGRFGPYVKHNEKFVSLPFTEDPMEVTLERAIELIQEKEKADAPVAVYKGKDVQKGKGRFGPFIKYDGMFINVSKKYDFDNLSQGDIEELIDAKIAKEANRYIVKYDAEQIAIENGRWGPFIRFKKKSIKLPKLNDKKMEAEDIEKLTLDQIKSFITAEIPDAFKAKAKAAAKPKAKSPAKPKAKAKPKTKK